MSSTNDNSSLSSPSSLIKENFFLGVKLIFYKWTALKLAVEHQWGGVDSEDKREWFIGEIIDYFEKSKKKKFLLYMHIFVLENFFLFFLDQKNADIEDLDTILMQVM